MKNINHSIVGSLILLALSACNNTKVQDASNLSEDELCVQVNELISQHSEGFQRIKGKLTTTKQMDIWDAKYQLVGKSCQVWRWSNAKQAYMCSLTVPDGELAEEKHKRAVNFSKRCLGSEWTEEVVDRKSGRAFRTVFSKPGLSTVASIHRIKTDGLFKSEWTVYYFIGDRDQTL